MPKLFKIGKYYVFFWSNENNEPIHIHVSEGGAKQNATKIWLTRNGGFVVAHNKSQISQRDINMILDLLSVHFFYICSEWKKHFNTDEIKFYC